MKKVNKRVIIVGLVSAFMICISAFTVPKIYPQAKSDTENYDSGTNFEKAKTKYTANKNKDVKSFLSKDQIVMSLKDKFLPDYKYVVKSVKLKSWKQHLEEDDPDQQESYVADPDRMVWVVVLDFPDGYENKIATYSKATITAVYDAETGDALEVRTKGNPIKVETPFD